MKPPSTSQQQCFKFKKSAISYVLRRLIIYTNTILYGDILTDFVIGFVKKISTASWSDGIMWDSAGQVLNRIP